MIDVHSRLNHLHGEQDPLRRVADDIAANVKVRHGAPLAGPGHNGLRILSAGWPWMVCYDARLLS